MAKIPTILEPGRADGKLVTSDSIFDKNKNIFQSELNDIQDTLNSNNPNKPLSANQGKVLKELLDAKVIKAGAIPLDDEPTEGNTDNVVTSNGVYKALTKKVNNSTFKEQNKKQDTKFFNLENKIKDIYPYTNDNQFIIADSKGNAIGIIDEKGIHSVGFETPEIKTINNGSNGLEITDSNGNVILRLNGKYGIPDIVGDFYKKNYAVPQTCWIDDDFAIMKNGQLLEQYRQVHDWCIENNVRLDFAFIPYTYSDGKDDIKRLTIRKQWEDENFRYLMHPIHDGWYNYKSDNVHNIEKVKTGIVKCIRFFKEQNILTNTDILVYPGSSSNFEDNIDVIKRYIDCGITATYSETNHLVDNPRLKLKRYSITFNSVKTKTVIKRELKEYIDRGDWVILYTHLYNYSIDNILDETTNTVANVLDVVGYVNSLCKLRPTEEIWRERKNLFNFYKR